MRRLPVMNLAMVVQRLMDLKDEERRKVRMEGVACRGWLFLLLA